MSARANFMTPIPVVASFDVLNAMLAERCRARQAERAGRHADTIGERLAADTAAHPGSARDAVGALREAGGAGVVHGAGALSRQRLFHPNGLRVPGRAGEGVRRRSGILCRGEENARHTRSYGQGVFVYDPLIIWR
jgi:hypothetical protein